MTVKTVKMSSGHQVYLPEEILEEAQIKEGQSFVLRVRGHTIELIPAEVAERALDQGLANLEQASLDKLTEAWDNPEDDVWNEV